MCGAFASCSGFARVPCSTVAMVLSFSRLKSRPLAERGVQEPHSANRMPPHVMPPLRCQPVCALPPQRQRLPFRHQGSFALRAGALPDPRPTHSVRSLNLGISSLSDVISLKTSGGLPLQIWRSSRMASPYGYSVAYGDGCHGLQRILNSSWVALLHIAVLYILRCIELLSVFSRRITAEPA